MRNLKTYLVIPMLSLTPMLAAAAEVDAGDFVSKRSEYVSLRPATTVELPALSDSDRISQLLADVTQTFYIGNWTGTVVYAGGSLTGSSVPYPLPAGLNPSAPYYYSGAGQALVPALTPWTQVFGYTTNPSDPTGAAKTCIWQIDVSVVNGACTANVTTNAYGTQGVSCILDGNSGVDPASCQLFVGVGLQ
ncbi:hypothetical protein [Archangium primigenium]|uniref:hypothetical protein n=1 Tax=[Archangium] primigenium TaxID=2792470 RepID=UPI00195E4E08|nr:hypothetical protein [Archangium primigenium]MBM7117247.1 hypothetical protein [Archangium primigenium]